MLKSFVHFIYKTLVPFKIKDLLWQQINKEIALREEYTRKTYSVEGEDIILSNIFGFYFRGFYVDIGAHHPKENSNTYKLYQRGWKGINIDAMPGSSEAFKIARPGDISIECAVSDVPGNLKYHQYSESQLNSFSETLIEYRINNKKLIPVKVIDVESQPLASIMDQYVANGQQIDFMNIDVEGYEMNVLRSGNWQKYKPRVIVLEDKKFNFSDLSMSEAYNFLTEKGYILISRLQNSTIYQHKDFNSLHKDDQ